MSMISLAAVSSRMDARSADNSFKTILLFCGAGLVVSFGLIAYGIDLGAGLMI